MDCYLEFIAWLFLVEKIGFLVSCLDTSKFFYWISLFTAEIMLPIIDLVIQTFMEG